MPNLVQKLPVAPLADTQAGNATPVWLNWFNNIYRLLGLAPTIYTGILAPTTTPSKIGDTFINTATSKVYVSTGTNSSADWKILN